MWTEWNDDWSGHRTGKILTDHLHKTSLFPYFARYFCKERNRVHNLGVDGVIILKRI
jgi:hypothetical protein